MSSQVVATCAKKIGTILLMWMIVAIQVPLAATAQDATPSASPEASQDFPKIAIVPVGDYPEGFIKDVPVQPGDSITLSVVVDNFGVVPVDLRTYKVNASSAVNGGFLAGQETEQPRGATAWIDYPSQDVHLEPGQKHEIAFSVAVPGDAAPGQYITGLVAETAEPLPIPGSDVLDQVIGFVMSVSFLVEGDLTHSFDLGQPEVAERSLQVPITNTGNYLVRPSGELTVSNAEGKAILTTPITMGSVYAGDTTAVSVGLPEQMPAGDYTVDLTLKDEPSGATDSIEGATVTVEEPEDPTAVNVAAATITPNADPIAFANVDITLDNGGQQIPASNVTLEVLRDGQPVESFPLATNQVLLNGENTFTDRYIPATAWEKGTYTFALFVSAVDPNGGQETILLDEELEPTIVVP